MPQKRDYKIGKSLISDQTIKKFTEIFDYVPRTVAAKDIGVHSNTLNNHIKNLGDLTLKEIVRLSNLLEIESMTIFKLAQDEFVAQEKKAKK